MSIIARRVGLLETYGLCDADNILVLQYEREGLSLDRRRNRELLRIQSAPELRMKVERSLLWRERLGCESVKEWPSRTSTTLLTVEVDRLRECVNVHLLRSYHR